MTDSDTLRAAALLRAHEEILDSQQEFKFIVRDSGARQQFSGGSQRDTDEGKPRFDLIPPGPLRRVAEHYAKGAAKYDEHNWALGQPLSRLQASAERHLQAWKEGDRVEDHLAAVIFNVLGMMFFEATEWDDAFDWTPPARPES